MEDYETQLNEAEDKIINQAKQIEKLKGENEELKDRLGRQLRANLSLTEIGEDTLIENTKLKGENEELRKEVQAEREIRVGHINQNNVISNWLVKSEKENTKLKCENEEFRHITEQYVRALLQGEPFREYSHLIVRVEQLTKE